MSHDELVNLLFYSKFHFSNEKDLQQGIAELFQAQGVEYQAEVTLTAKDRIDFLVGSVGIEIKIKSSTNTVTRQLLRYAQRPEIESLILVTTKQIHRLIPTKLVEKPVTVIWLLYSAL